MIIDFHTHVFPDKIAAPAVASMAERANIPPHSDGTADGLKQSMKKAGVDISVVMPVVTNPKQFDSINRFASELNGKDRLYSFGGIHPDNDDIEAKLEYIKSLGLRGVKIHPDYQHTYIDDEKYVRIISACIGLDLYVVTHSGVDVGYPEPVHCTPDRVLSLLSKLPEHSAPRLILAHTGACDMYEEVYEKLCGKNVYFDLAFSLDRVDRELLYKIIEKHGSDKILFATDSPWSSQTEYRQIFDSLSLSGSEREAIAHKNAERILKI